MQSNESLTAPVTNRAFNSIAPSTKQPQQQQQHEEEGAEDGVASATVATSERTLSEKAGPISLQSHDPSSSPMSQTLGQPERDSGSAPLQMDPSWYQSTAAAPSEDAGAATNAAPRSIEEKLRMLEQERREVSQSLVTARSSPSSNSSHDTNATSSTNTSSSNNNGNNLDQEQSNTIIPSTSTTGCSLPTSATITSSSSSSSSPPPTSSINMTPVALDTISTPRPDSQMPSTPIASSDPQPPEDLQSTPVTNAALASTENVAAAVLPYLSSFASSPSKHH
ncbi:hypothetical protein BGW42_000333 [Actinomortierella wolfii]|nr:hypothetical protein BGW42_000333 [Actinomortierella wolfii]